MANDIFSHFCQILIKRFSKHLYHLNMSFFVQPDSDECFHITTSQVDQFRLLWGRAMEAYWGISCHFLIMFYCDLTQEEHTDCIHDCSGCHRGLACASCSSPSAGMVLFLGVRMFVHVGTGLCHFIFSPFSFSFIFTMSGNKWIIFITEKFNLDELNCCRQGQTGRMSF